MKYISVSVCRAWMLSYEVFSNEKRKKILPQSLNFVIGTKRPFIELQRLFVPMAFIFRLHNN